MYRPQHFILKELVPPDVYRDRGESAWELFDPRALVTLDQIREQFGPIIVNDWHRGGGFSYSGFRPANCKIGAQYSQHRYGRAFDCKSPKASAEEMRAFIRKNPGKFPHLTALERNVSWLHFDVRNVQAIKEFDP